jgi:hypothetical protein
MSPRIARIVELGSAIAIGIAFLFGGRVLLVNLSHIPRYAIPVLIVLGLLQGATLWRDAQIDGPSRPLVATRDVAFIAAVLLSIAFIAAPARWSIGAAVVAIELGIVLEVFGQLRAPA